MKQALHFLHKKRCFLHKIQEVVYGFLFAQAVCVACLRSFCCVFCVSVCLHILHNVHVLCSRRRLLLVFYIVYLFFIFCIFYSVRTSYMSARAFVCMCDSTDCT